MSDLIRREDVIARIKSVIPPNSLIARNYYIDLLKAFPPVDAVGVVRCNICRYYETDVGWCHYHCGWMHWDGFCSLGKRREENAID